MTKILIEDIEKEVNGTLFYEFNEFMEEFGADVFADLTLKSLGQFIEITGTAQGKLKLTCDRCLNEYDYDLDIDDNIDYIDEKGADEASKYIFMVPEEDTTVDGNVYEEYIVINGVIEVVGKWATDLTDYVTKDALSKDLANYVKSTDLTATLGDYAKTSDVTAVTTELGELATAVENKVEKEEGSRLITEEEAQKLEDLKLDGEANYVKSVTADFTVNNAGELSLNKDTLDLSENTTVKTLANRVTNLDTSVSTLSGNLASLEASLGANASAIEALQSAQATTTEAINKNKKDIEDLNTKAGNLETQLNELSGKITTNENNISNLEAQLNNYVLQSTYNKDIAEIRDILT